MGFFFQNVLRFLSGWGIRISTLIVCLLIYQHMLIPAKSAALERKKELRDAQVEIYILENKLKSRNGILTALKEDPEFICRVIEYELRIKVKAPKQLPMFNVQLPMAEAQDVFVSGN